MADLAELLASPSVSEVWPERRHQQGHPLRRNCCEDLKNEIYFNFDQSLLFIEMTNMIHYSLHVNLPHILNYSETRF